MEERTAVTQEADEQHLDFRSEPYAWTVVAILCLGSVISMIDRQVINLLVEPIKADLLISDTQISLLQGFAFSLFYAVMAIPIGRLVDRSSRRNIIASGAVLFSAATFACGLARGFGGLFTARMAVGVGEATLMPAAFSLIGDYIKRGKIAFAISLLVGSSYIGGGIALVAIGALLGLVADINLTLPLVGVVKDWHLVFMIASLPGLMFALIMMLLVREPPREGVAKTEKSVPLSEIWAFLGANASVFLPVMLGLPILAAASFGLNAWVPTFFIRSYGWTAAQIGPVFGIMVLVLSPCGILLGGWLADRLLTRGYKDAYLRVPGYSAILALPFMVLFPLAGSADISLALLAPVLVLGAMPFGAGAAAIPALAPNRIRGQLTAIYMLIANLVGAGMGPWAVAVFTDSALGDPQQLYLSLSIVGTALFVTGALAMLLGLRAFALQKRKATSAF